MAITHTRLLQFYQNFGKFYTWQFTPCWSGRDCPCGR